MEVTSRRALERESQLGNDDNNIFNDYNNIFNDDNNIFFCDCGCSSPSMRLKHILQNQLG